MKIKRVAFDFDETLEYECVQDYAKELIERGYEIWIVTARNSIPHPPYVSNEDLYEVADKLKINYLHIKFTNELLKYHYFKTRNNAFILHIDNDDEEVNAINKNCEIKAIEWINDPNWKNKCDKILKNYESSID